MLWGFQLLQGTDVALLLLHTVIHCEGRFLPTLVFCLQFFYNFVFIEIPVRMYGYVYTSQKLKQKM